MSKYILSVDAGTTSSRAILFDHAGNAVCVSQKEFPQIYPKPAWVEHNAKIIWQTQKEVIDDVIIRSGAKASDIAGIGITNQRETTVVWDKNTGEPVYNAIVWQCRRTAPMIEKLVSDGLSDYVKKTTGLIPDAYFSASKIAWILDNVKGARGRAEKGELLFGTIDTWLIWNLTCGESHATDVTNASRTMLFDIHNLCWDEKLLEYFNIPRQMLPRVTMSSEIVGYYNMQHALAPEGGTAGDQQSIPIAGIAGDQQAALFGQCCFNAGDVKNTYGTGCFTLMNTGGIAVESKNGLLTTIACGLTDGNEKKISYALEGSVFIAGAAVQWLRDELGLIKNAAESETCCNSVPDTGGVYIVPAFSGMGAPYWNPEARGTVTGLTRGTNKNHFVRATVESLAYQVYDLIKVMELDMANDGTRLTSLKVDGGASANNFLMQFQSDLLNIDLARPACLETTALGAAYLAGLATGFWSDLREIKENWNIEKTFSSTISEEERNAKLSGWKHAVDTALFAAK